LGATTTPKPGRSSRSTRSRTKQGSLTLMRAAILSIGSIRPELSTLYPVISKRHLVTRSRTPMPQWVSQALPNRANLCLCRMRAGMESELTLSRGRGVRRQSPLSPPARWPFPGSVLPSTDRGRIHHQRDGGKLRHGHRCWGHRSGSRGGLGGREELPFRDRGGTP
jgi:hypothetical protein